MSLVFKSLEEAQKYVMGNLKTGCKCPCCGKKCKEDNRVLNYAMAKSLILIYKYFEENPDKEWLRIQHHFDELQSNGTKVPPGRQASMLRHWGMLERPTNNPDPAAPMQGMYKITDTGRRFVRGEVTMPKVAVVFKDEVLRFSEGRITIDQALGIPFDYKTMLDAGV